MILWDEDKIKSLNKLTPNDIYILTDFDGTITKVTSDSSWASIFKNPQVSQEFIDECTKIYEHYHKYEVDENLSLEEKLPIMKEWYEQNIATLKKFNITKDIIDYAANNNRIIDFRDGAADFLKRMFEKNIPVIIISAGVGNIIEQFLIKNNCNYPNIYICSNFLEYQDNLITGVKDNNLIHPLNKNEVSIPPNVQEQIKDRNNAILLGNSIADLDMASNQKNVYKISFLDEQIIERVAAFKEVYNVICMDRTSFDELKELIDLFS